MTHKTTNTASFTVSSSNTAKMGNENKKTPKTSLAADDSQKHSTTASGKDVARWSSAEVQHWIKQQCKKFELPKSIADQFQMNGQALMLLTKHDFIRRSSQGGEILFYALQRLIGPSKVTNLSKDTSSTSGNAANGEHPRIVEIGSDHEEYNDTTDPSSPKPIVEEPDDPPLIRRSHSENLHTNHQQQNTFTYLFNPAQVPQAVITMPSGAAAAFFQQHRRFSSGYPYGQAHPNFHMHQHMFYPPNFQQYYPMMSAQGILIEIMDDDNASNISANGVNQSTSSFDGQEALYLVTINGQRYVMNEAQVTQLVTEVYQHEALQRNLQQQQQRFRVQQQRVFQQQQQQQQQQQRRF